MKKFSLGKGRKKEVKKFTARNGLWIILIVAGGMIIMLVLWLLGVSASMSARLYR